MLTTCPSVASSLSLALLLFAAPLSGQCLKETFVAQNGDALEDAVDLQGGRALYFGARAAHLFDENSGIWAETELPVASGEVAYLGDVALDGSTAVFGVANASNFQGSVSVFEEHSGGWTESLLPMPPGRPVGYFGGTVCVLGDLLTVGAWYGGYSYEGHAYVYRRSAGTWNFEAELLPPEVNWEGFFGKGIDMGHDFIAVGGPELSQPVFYGGSGKVCIYAEGPSGWTMVDQVFPISGPSFTNCGEQVSVHGDRILASHRKTGKVGGVLFDRLDGGTTDPLDDRWVQVADLRLPSTVSSNRLSLALANGVAVIGTTFPSEYWVFVETPSLGWVRSGPFARQGTLPPNSGAHVNLEGDQLIVDNQLLGFTPRSASVTYRGAAPLYYHTTDVPVLGQAWTARIVSSQAPITFIAYGAGGPTAPIPTAFGELLCLPPYPKFVFSPEYHSIPIPNNCSLTTETLATQGGYYDSSGVTLLNAIDLHPGY